MAPRTWAMRPRSTASVLAGAGTVEELACPVGLAGQPRRLSGVEQQDGARVLVGGQLGGTFVRGRCRDVAATITGPVADVGPRRGDRRVGPCRGVGPVPRPTITVLLTVERVGQRVLDGGRACTLPRDRSPTGPGVPERDGPCRAPITRPAASAESECARGDAQRPRGAHHQVDVVGVTGRRDEQQGLGVGGRRRTRSPNRCSTSAPTGSRSGSGADPAS